MCKRISAAVHDNGSVQFTFFLVLKLNITIVTNCDALIVILVIYFCIIKVLKKTKKTCPKGCLNKILIWKISCIYFPFYNM